MIGPIAALACGLAILLTILTPASVLAAQDLPTVAAPKTAHLTLDLVIAADDKEFVIKAEGDFDFARGASRLTLTLEGLDGDSLTVEQVIVDGRTYSRIAGRDPWTYTDRPAPGVGGIDTPVPVPNPSDQPTIRFRPAGTEQIGGDATTRYTADLALAFLLPSFERTRAEATYIEQAGAVNVFIGAANNYLYRLALDTTGTITQLRGESGPVEAPVSLAIGIALGFSNFNAPVEIAAPANAIPARTRAAGDLVAALSTQEAELLDLAAWGATQLVPPHLLPLEVAASLGGVLAP
jgi:hypothetical protein